MPMHIKLVVNSFPSTSETFLFNLVVGLQAKGHRVSVCALSASNHTELYKGRMNEWSGELDVIPFSSKGFNKIIGILSVLLSNIFLYSQKLKVHGWRKGILQTVYEVFLSKNKPDIIHFAYSGIGVSFLESIPLLKGKGIKIVTSCRGSAEKVRPIVDLKRKDELKQLFVVCDKVHCVSMDMFMGLRQYGLVESKSFVNFPSVNVHYFNRDSPYELNRTQTIKLVTTGRLHFQKGYVYALHAIKKVIDAGFKIEYKIIGDGPDLHMMQYLIHELGLHDIVVLTGKVSSSEVKTILMESDIFVLPSLYEGIANAALEAMALQIPLVTTRSGGMAEVINNEANGIIVNRFDLDALADAILKLIQHPELRLSISKESRKVIEEKFNIENQLKIFEKNYLELCS
jgi:colanic acid/amylovoran biosynthesis glycosyltransferase